MPFDLAAAPVAIVQSFAQEAGEPDPAWAAENPDQALAFLFLAPRPCAALDAILAA